MTRRAKEAYGIMLVGTVLAAVIGVLLQTVWGWVILGLSLIVGIALLTNSKTDQLSESWILSLPRSLSGPPDLDLLPKIAEGIEDLRKSVTPPPTTKRPSLVFVFGAPLGDNDSAQWIMMLTHYGPGSAHNCEVIFYDDDRTNIEHEWLVKHPDIPYPPLGLAGESKKRIYISEAGPEGSAGSFKWNPVNPNSQHYTVSISCRDGVFVEKWEVTRVNGILRSAISIEHGPLWIQKNPGKHSVIFQYQDPEFVRTVLATEMPKVSTGKMVHPGWKPRHRFEVPAAIVDPNGNVQVVSGVRLPDGTTATDFGSWNILTRHFGD